MKGNVHLNYIIDTSPWEDEGSKRKKPEGGYPTGI